MLCKTSYVPRMRRERILALNISSKKVLEIILMMSLLVLLLSEMASLKFGIISGTKCLGDKTQALLRLLSKLIKTMMDF